MSPPLHIQLGLTDDEYDDIKSILGREPNRTELAMYSVMWSEHCSYKSSKMYLRNLPTEAPWVLVGPGENAGVVDVGDGIAVALRIESHNHPSAVEPFQGAATGAGGILRDVFTMGARPIALMDSLRFGPLSDARSRWIAEGVVSGISSYGNAVGVPTVGGETVFDETYIGNPLVNVLCMGVLPKERLVLGRASGVGNVAVLLGSSTGRDGIGGASVLASASFEEGDSSKRPSVQTGDPFSEKLLIEACLQLLDEQLVVGIQDLGAAGIACATSETASRGKVGMDVNLSAIPLREADMEPWEVMISESQERMLAIVQPEDLERVFKVCEHWDVRSSVIGRVTEGPNLRVLRADGEVLADLPASSLHDAAPEYSPEYRRPISEPGDLAERRAKTANNLPITESNSALLNMLIDTSWVYSQYDHQLFLNTVIEPGGDASVLRLKAPGIPRGSERALALTTDGNNRWCAVDPRQGTAMLMAEATLNIACTGAKSIAVVNNLNFGSPENRETMWQLREAIEGLREGCLALNVPVIGGNVSLYNTSDGVDIDPTPVLGVLGVIEQLDGRPSGIRLIEGGDMYLLGETQLTLNGSRWAKEQHGFVAGNLPTIDWELHKRLLVLVADLQADALLDGIHDVADGGLAACIAEMCVQSGIGVNIEVADHIELFSESPSRVVVCVSKETASDLQVRAKTASISCTKLGSAGGSHIQMGSLINLSVEDAANEWRNRLPQAISAGATH